MKNEVCCPECHGRGYVYRSSRSNVPLEDCPCCDRRGRLRVDVDQTMKLISPLPRLDVLNPTM